MPRSIAVLTSCSNGVTACAVDTARHNPPATAAPVSNFLIRPFDLIMILVPPTVNSTGLPPPGPLMAEQWFVKKKTKQDRCHIESEQRNQRLEGRA